MRGGKKGGLKRKKGECEKKRNVPVFFRRPHKEKRKRKGGVRRGEDGRLRRAAVYHAASDRGEGKGRTGKEWERGRRSRHGPITNHAGKKKGRGNVNGKSGKEEDG